MTPGSRAIYLLHFDQKIGRVQHYLGSAYIERLSARWTEHSRGRGASLTTAAAKKGLGFTAFILEKNVPSLREKTLKQRGQFHNLCPICSNLEILIATGTHYVPDLRSSAPVFSADQMWTPYE